MLTKLINIIVIVGLTNALDFGLFIWLLGRSFVGGNQNIRSSECANRELNLILFIEKQKLLSNSF